MLIENDFSSIEGHKIKSLRLMDVIIRFEESGSFYKKGKINRFLLLVKKKLLAINMFIRCLIHYKTSIKANELDIISCWQLCDSMADAQIGRTLRIVR